MFQLVKYLGYAAFVVVAFHVFILSFMVLAILYQPDAVQHTVYWDRLLGMLVK